MKFRTKEKISKFLVRSRERFSNMETIQSKIFYVLSTRGRTSVLEGDINFADTAINGSLLVDRVDG